MKLYHGTSLKNLPKILRTGIKPRRRNSKGNWGHSFISNEGYVYLTDSYPLFFANQACKGNDKPVIVEVEVDEDILFPDEDYIRYAIAKKYGVGYKEAEDIMLRLGYNVETNQHVASESLKRIGSVCHRGTIPPLAITRVCVLYDKWLVYGHVDHAVADPMAHSVLSIRYQNLLEYLFNGKDYKTWEEMAGLPPHPVFLEMFKKAKKNFTIIKTPISVKNLAGLSKRKWSTTAKVSVLPPWSNPTVYETRRRLVFRKREMNRKALSKEKRMG